MIFLPIALVTTTSFIAANLLLLPLAYCAGIANILFSDGICFALAGLIAGPFLLLISVICDSIHFLRRLYNPSAYQLNGPDDLKDLNQLADEEMAPFDLKAFTCLYQAVAQLIAPSEKVTCLSEKQVIKETARLMDVKSAIYAMVYQGKDCHETIASLNTIKTLVAKFLAKDSSDGKVKAGALWQSLKEVKMKLVSMEHMRRTDWCWPVELREVTDS